MVTSLMELVVVGVTCYCYVVTCSSVASVVCMHTVHRPVSVLLYTHAITALLRRVVYLHMNICINTECFGKPVLTHACVWIVCSWTCGLYTTCLSFTLDGLYTYPVYIMHHNTNSTHFDSVTVHTYSIYDPLIQCFC